MFLSGDTLLRIKGLSPDQNILYSKSFLFGEGNSYMQNWKSNSIQKSSCSTIGHLQKKVANWGDPDEAAYNKLPHIDLPCLPFSL